MNKKPHIKYRHGGWIYYSGSDHDLNIKAWWFCNRMNNYGYQDYDASPQNH